MEFTVYDWMMGEGLRGNDLIMFAYIHACGTVELSIDDLAAATAMSRRSAINIADSLQEKGFINIEHKPGGKNVYSVGVQNLHPSSAKSAPHPCKICTPLADSTSLKNINNINNNIYITHTLDARTRTREDNSFGWADEDIATRMGEGIQNGGTMRDNMLRALMATGATVTVPRLQQLADMFVADQRIADSNHVNDGDFRMHFVRWASRILKDEANRQHADERFARRNMTTFERAQLSRQQAEQQFFDDLQRRLENETNNNPYEQ